MDKQNAQTKSEYDRFKDFTRAIIAVPKSEIDAAAKIQSAAEQKARISMNDSGFLLFL